MHTVHLCNRQLFTRDPMRSLLELRGFTPIGMVEWWNLGMMGLKEFV